MKMTVMVLGVNSWEFDGNKGTSLFYTGVTPTIGNGKNGIFPTKKSISQDLGNILQNVKLPALCAIDFDMTPQASGKLDLLIHNIEHLKPIKLD